MEFKIEFAPSSASDTKKQNDRAKLKQLLNAVCAILNTCKEGGKLILFSESHPYSMKDADDITRKIEQKIQTTFGLEAMREILNKIPQTNEQEVFEMHYEINQTTLFTPPVLYTINYNLYCTTDTQVHDIPSVSPLDSIVSVITGERVREQKAVLGEHLKEFVFGEKVHLEESKRVQLKKLADDKDGACTLADRMTNESNKLLYYVSAFANGSGGHIYYGIEMNASGFYVAYGQTVKDKEKIINKVKSSIDKVFVWRPGKKEFLNKGKQWEIFFEEVSNTDEAKYVIVISVNSHDRGVFAREPESYVFDKKTKRKIQPMEFSEWTERFLLANCRNIFSNKISPLTIGRGEWSTPDALKNHLTVLGKLVILRNDGCKKEFDAYRNELINSQDANSKCLLQQQEAANFFRKRSFHKAMEKLEENKKVLNETPAKCTDVGIYQTRRLYWKGVVARAQGSYDESRKLCDEAIQNLENCPTILVLPWIHYNRAKLLEISLANKKDTHEEQSLRASCIDYYERALRSSFTLEDYPENLVTDLKQRVLIAMARVAMGACFDGEHVVHTTCSPCDVKRADDLMKAVDYSVENEGLSMTKLSKAEYLLVHSEQDYNRWKKSSSKPVFIERALEACRQALVIAKTGDFKDVIVFAEAQITYLERMRELPT